MLSHRTRTAGLGLLQGMRPSRQAKSDDMSETEFRIAKSIGSASALLLSASLPGPAQPGCPYGTP